MSFADPQRIRQLIADNDLDGLLVVSPENFTYMSGVSGFPATMWRRVGPASAIIKADGSATFIVPDTREKAVQDVNPDAQILSHPLWIERIDVDVTDGDSADAIIERATADRDAYRPETYDETMVFRHVQEAIADQGLMGKRIGVELEFAPAVDVDRLNELLPDTQLVNSSPLFRELRIIKTEPEIELLRLGNKLTDLGIMASLEGLNEETIQLDIYAKYHEAVFAAAREQHIIGFTSARTTVHLGPFLWGTGDPLRPAQRGDNIQFDSGVQISGYNTDIGRTFTFGPANDIQKRIEDALLAGYEAGLAELKPGRRYCDVFMATQEAVRKNGFPSYTRGHFGHSIGSEIFGEEWPWISESEERLIEPGMVIAFEVPYYINGIGGFQNEDNLLITEDGAESFNALPMELVTVG